MSTALHTDELPSILPPALRESRNDLDAALAKPLLAQWPDDATFANAEQPKAIAAVLIQSVHPHLEKADIVFLYKEKMSKRDRVILGKAGKASSLIGFLAGHTYIMYINWAAYRGLTPMQRVALIDHELMHFSCVRDPDTGEDTFVLASHDLEEFRDIVSRWGYWKDDIAEFAETVMAVQQNLFDPGSL